MAEPGHPNRKARCRLHGTSREMVKALEKRLGLESWLLLQETLEFPGAWFIGHIRNEAQRFAAFALTDRRSRPAPKPKAQEKPHFS